jgi:membrane protein involved in colicin uptake
MVPSSTPTQSHGDALRADAAKKQKEFEDMMKQAEIEDTAQKKQQRAEKKWKEVAEAKRKAEEAVRKAVAESAKRKAGSAKGKSKEVTVESDDDSEEPEVPKMKKRKLVGGKSKMDETVVKVVVPCFR